MMIANKKEKGWACLVTTQVVTRQLPDTVSLSQKSLSVAKDQKLACFARMPSLVLNLPLPWPYDLPLLNEPEINQNYFVMWSNTRSVVQKAQLLQYKFFTGSNQIMSAFNVGPWKTAYCIAPPILTSAGSLSSITTPALSAQHPPSLSSPRRV